MEGALFAPTPPFVREELPRCFDRVARAQTLSDRCAALSAASALLSYVTDEATVADLLHLLRRAIDCEDLLTLRLAYDIPRWVDGKETGYQSTFRLAEYAFRRNRLTALPKLLLALLIPSFRDEEPRPARDWLVALLNASPPEQSREDVARVVDSWGWDGEADVTWLKELLRDRPKLLALLPGDEELEILAKAMDHRADEVPF